MPLWGRNDQSVTANSVTTVESSNGAPIGTHALVKSGGGNTSVRVDGANAHFGNTSPGSRANVDVAMFNNTTADAFIPGITVGVFGVDANEITAERASGAARPAHAGWVLRTVGSGGRAGRVQYETLVAMGSLGAQTAAYGTPATTSDSEDTIFQDGFITIASQPSNATANASSNQSNTFTVGVSMAPGTATPTYLWYYATAGAGGPFSTTAAVSGFSGQTTTTLTANAATLAANVWVLAAVSVTGGASVNTSVAKLTVTT